MGIPRLKVGDFIKSKEGCVGEDGLILGVVEDIDDEDNTIHVKYLKGTDPYYLYGNYGDAHWIKNIDRHLEITED